MPFDQLLALLAFALVSAITPGPNNAMLLASGVNFGLRRTVPHIVGINIGFPVMVLAIGLGLAQVFTTFPALYTILKIVSVAYLLWLAWRIGCAGPATASDDDAAAARPMSFLEAAAFQWVNPKAWIMGIGAFAAYSIPGQPVASALIVAAAYVAMGFPSSAVWAGFGAGLRRFLSDPRRLRTFNVLMALVLAASLIPVIVDLIRGG
ncbi:MAG TPA: LysE family translocator [Hyphomicrobiaceae bacterium]|nr:LysE family translocator [Hyphomicrobiaceae bacterium]